MKNKSRFLITTLVPLGLHSLLAPVTADVTKADNTTTLNLGGSYAGGVAPVATDHLIIDGTLTAARTANLGDNVSILGITGSSANTLTIGATAGKTLTIGADGIVKTGGAGELVLNNATSLGGNISLPVTSTGRITFGGTLGLTSNQTWALGINRINVNNTLSTGGNTLAISGGSGSIIRFGSTNTLGTDITISNAGAMFLDPGAGTITINGVNNSNGTASLFTGTLNMAAMGNVSGSSSIGKAGLQIRAQSTVNYTGTTASSNKGMVRDTNSGVTLGDTTFNVTTTGETLTMSGNFTHQGTTQTGAWNFGGAGNLTLNGVVQNGSATRLNKNNAGTLTLGGANTYAGATTVNGGTLLVNGTHNITTAGADYTVKSGAALGGTGRVAVNGLVTLENGASLTPGASIGTLTMDGVNTSVSVLTMATGSTFAIELDGSGGTPDRLDFWNYAGSDLTLNNNAINLSLAGTQAPGTYSVDVYRFFGDSGTTGSTHAFSSGLTIGALDPNISSAVIDWDGTANDSKAIALTYTVVPEPGAAALAGGLGLFAMLRRRQYPAVRG